MIVAARFVVPVAGPVIEGGAVYIEAGLIRAVGRAKDMPNTAAFEDHGDAVILPGLVNAHTHLELSHLRGFVPPGPSLVDWLTRLIEQRARHPLDEGSAAAIMHGAIHESLRAGVTTVGDVTASPRWTRPALRGAGIRAVSFGEVIAIGTRQGGLDDQLSAAASTDDQTENLRVGISPHAPYTASPEAMRVCAERACANALPMCIHLAESREEDAFTRTASGPFAAFLQARGVWDERITACGVGPVELAERTGLLFARCVIAHANHVDDDDLDRIARSGASVAYCPRTHAAFGQPPHRFAEMLDRGINVCLGTDSLASNPDLDIFGELRFLRERFPHCPAQRLIEMATIRGARALGFENSTGSLIPGKSADLVVMPLDRAGDERWDSILRSARLPVAVYARGERIDVAR
jgi:cytosine/adenosine deaminase-related metal-dependent hydrolase